MIKPTMWIAHVLVACATMASSQAVLAQHVPPPTEFAPRAIINEYYPAPTSGQTEFIELILQGFDVVNSGDAPVIQVKDASGSWSTLPISFPLRALDTLVIARSPELLPRIPASVHVATVSPWPSLNNSGDSLFLRIDSEVIEKIGYEQSTSGKSIERISSFWPGTWSSNWGFSEDPTGSTPGRTNSIHHENASAPLAQAAEFEAPNTLIIWFSEPVLDRDPIQLTVELTSGGHRVLTGYANINKLVVPWESASGIQSVVVSEFRDYEGVTGSKTQLDVAYPPESGELQLSELHFLAQNPANSVLDPSVLHTIPAPEFLQISNRTNRLISLRGLTLYIGNHALALTHPDSLVLLKQNQPFIVTQSDWTDLNTVIQHNTTWVENSDLHPLSTLYTLNPPPIFGIEPHLSFSNHGETLRLAYQGVSIDSTTFDEELLDQRFKSHRGRSIVRIPSASQSWFSSLTPTGYSLGLQPHSISVPDAGKGVIVSEILFDPLADDTDGLPDQAEFIELVNTQPYPVVLQGFAARSAPDETGASDPIFRINAPLILATDQVAVVYQLPSSYPDDPQSQLELIEQIWPSSASIHTAVFIPVRQSLSLSNSEDRFQTVSSRGAVIESIFYQNSDHYPGLLQTKGRSLYRPLVTQETTPPSVQIGSWTTTTHAEGATPGVAIRSTHHADAGTEGKDNLIVYPHSIYPEYLDLGAQTEITLSSKNTSSVATLEVYDRNGYLVRTLSKGTFLPEKSIFYWDGRNNELRVVRRGVYLVVASFYAENGKLNKRIKKPVSVLRGRRR